MHIHLPGGKITFMKSIALIPARYAATRFPGKLMQLLGNKSVILLRMKIP